MLDCIDINADVKMLDNCAASPDGCAAVAPLDDGPTLVNADGIDEGAEDNNAPP